MKKLHLLFLTFTLFVSIEIQAQYYENYGLDRRIGASMRGNNSKSKPKQIDYAEESVNYFKKELNLDDFQAAVFKSIFSDYIDTAMYINSSSDLNDIKKEKLKLESDKMNEKFIEILNPDQVKKYEELKNKKDKKNKKSKKNKTEDSENSNSSEE